MTQNGAVLFKNFDMSKDPEGFRRVWEALGAHILKSHGTVTFILCRVIIPGH
jgi:hypothetical protein